MREKRKRISNREVGEKKMKPQEKKRELAGIGLRGNKSERAQR